MWVWESQLTPGDDSKGVVKLYSKKLLEYSRGGSKLYSLTPTEESKGSGKLKVLKEMMNGPLQDGKKEGREFTPIYM